MATTEREKHIENLKKLKSFHNGSYGASINYAISSLRTDLKYDLMYEGEEVYTKADMATMLEEAKSEMNPIKECEQQIYGKDSWGFVGKCQDTIQSKIDKLKEDKDGME